MSTNPVTTDNNLTAIPTGSPASAEMRFRPIDPLSEHVLVTEERIAEALSLPNKYAVRALRRKKKIPFVKVGYRTYRYSISDCVRALKKTREVKAIGQ